MCGILFTLCSSQLKNGSDDVNYQEEISNRGPDSLLSHTLEVPVRPSSATNKTSTSTVRLEFVSSVLALRGQEIVRQPLVDPSFGVLCWNGQVFDGLDVGKDENDTDKIWQALKAGVPIARVLEHIEGP